jgi:hypothetical protein
MLNQLPLTKHQHVQSTSINQASTSSGHGLDIVPMEVEGNSPMCDEVQEIPDNESVHS